ncbi:MAG: VTT domain-containing protein [Byssovorax sp.]
MDKIRDFFQLVLHADELLKWGGYPALMLIIFAETGLLIGFFLPGDSLLVTAGVFVQANLMNPFGLEPFMNLLVMNVTLMAMAILGDAVGFSIGYRAGPRIFTRKQSFFFRKDHLDATQAFYEKHGGKTIILARFMPFARTFAPIVAGVGRMSYRKFLTFNVIGAVSWVFSMTFLGYFLGKILPAKDIEHVVWLIVFISVAPMIFGALRKWLTKKPVATPSAD